MSTSKAEADIPISERNLPICIADNVSLAGVDRLLLQWINLP